MKVSKEIVSNDKKNEPLIFISNRAISLYNDNKILKARIDKAIEYIEKQEDYFNEYPLINRQELLDILKGSDTNG